MELDTDRAAFADGVQKLKDGDLLLIFGYRRAYRQLTVLFDEADRRGVAKKLPTDALGSMLEECVDLILSVARGRTDMLSMHTATFALIEALLVELAAKRPKEIIAHLESWCMSIPHFDGAKFSSDIKELGRRSERHH